MGGCSISARANVKDGAFFFVYINWESSGCKNTSYNFGVHCYGYFEKHHLVPTVSVGHNFKNFFSDNISNYNGTYFSLRLRL